MSCASLRVASGSASARPTSSLASVATSLRCWCRRSMRSSSRGWHGACSTTHADPCAGAMSRSPRAPASAWPPLQRAVTRCNNCSRQPIWPCTRPSAAPGRSRRSAPRRDRPVRRRRPGPRCAWPAEAQPRYSAAPAPRYSAAPAPRNAEWPILARRPPRAELRGPPRMTAASTVSVTSGRQRSLEHAALGAGWFSSGIGVLALLGWFAHVPALTQVLPGWSAMRVSTALSFVLCGLSLVGLTRRDERQRERRAALAAALLVLCIGLWALVECLAGDTPSVDRALAALLRRPDAYPGRVSAVAALNVALVGLSLVGLGLPGKLGH